MNDEEELIVDSALSLSVEDGKTERKKFSLRLGAFLVNAEVKNFAQLLAVEMAEVQEFAIDKKYGFDGIIYVKRKPTEVKRPVWAGYLDVIHGNKIEGLETASSSAILLIKTNNKVVVFSFGYGRYLLNDEYLVPDFGIKTALNTLDHNTLRTVDLFSLEQAPIQKRAQATRSANINDFGIDVSRDVLKAVTGEPIKGIDWSTISGGGAQYSFTTRIFDYGELLGVAGLLLDKYSLDSYSERFGWVDNIQRIKNSAKLSELNNLLVSEIREANAADISISLPQVSDWGNIFGFSYTNGRKEFKASPDISDYYACNEVKEIDLDKLKQHRVHCALISGEEESYSLYDCIYFECQHEGKLHILFSRQWFTIDQDYVARVETAVSAVPLSSIDFPKVKLVAKQKKAKSRKAKAVAEDGEEDEEVEDSITLESEGDYNMRVANAKGYVLMDKKLVKSDSSASPIEVCDMLSSESHYIHAKHKKGNSSGLSHLFAQGRVASELLLSDQNFRKNARKHLSGTSRNLIPIGKFSPRKSEIVFLVLGVHTNEVVKSIPFFSKINLISAHRNLTERQFKVSIAGAEPDDTTLSEVLN